MSTETKNKLVPRFRFPEFKDAGEWKETILDKVAEYENGIAHEKDIDENGEYIVVNSKFISTDGEVKKFTNTPFCIANKGDILMVLSDVPNGKAIAKCYIVEEHNRYTVNQRICRITPRKLNPKILYYELNRNPYFLAFDDGVNQTNLRKEDVLKCPLLIPEDSKEQEKIANTLSLVDDLINAQRQKIELLKQHKKGLLQNLFPQEGEKVPKLRFPEFKDAGEWEVKKLGEVCEFLKGKGISKQDICDNGSQPCIRYGELYTTYNEIIKEIKSFTNLSSDELILSEENDVIIPSSGETKEDIAKASCIKVKGVALGGDINILRSSLNGEFLAYYLSYALKENISKIAQGDAVVHLYATQLKKLEMSFPSLPEQQKIASCLSSLDDLINAQRQKIELLKQHKKGLLQGLFPNVNEINL